MRAPGQDPFIPAEVTPARARPNAAAHRVSLWWGVLPLAFLVSTVLFYSFRYVFEFDTDEGINAIKALLTLRGFVLYSEIWNDQPPAFTLMLAFWFRIFGLRIVAGRVLVLLFSVALVAAVVHYLRRSWGGAAAVAGLLFLFLLPLYRQLSVSIMIGLPSIALGVLSFASQAMWHEKRRPAWLVLSATLLALSVLTKAFTSILVPAWMLGIALAIRASGPPGANRLRSWMPLVTWFVPFAAITGLAILAVVRPENIGQLLQVHLAAGRTPAFQPSELAPPINYFLKGLISLFLLAGVGAFQAVRTRTWHALYLAGWGISAYGLLLVNRPTWPHHQLLVTVPAAMLAAIAVGTSIRDLRRWRPSGPAIPSQWPMSLVTLGVALVFAVARGPSTLREFDLGLPNLRGAPTGNLQERQLVALLYDHAQETTWVFTDRPMFAFLARLPVPPYLAVLSSKRLLTGELTEAKILAVLEEYKPEMILSGRLGLPVIEEYMRLRNYRRIDSTPAYRLYFRQGSP